MDIAKWEQAMKDLREAVAKLPEAVAAIERFVEALNQLPPEIREQADDAENGVG